MFKRKADEAGLQGSPPETVAQVAEFVETWCPEPFAKVAAAKVRENGIDGAVSCFLSSSRPTESPNEWS